MNNAGITLGEVLYEGNKTRVCKARDEKHGRDVALKMLKPEAEGRGLEKRLEWEYEVLGRVDSPWVVRALDLVPMNGSPALVMEYFPGRILFELAGNSGLNMEQRLDLAQSLGQGLADIHAARIIHRDINPYNILVDPESLELRYLDFGISSSLGIQHSAQYLVGGGGRLEGHPDYISPEQTGRVNLALDQRTDFYSLGCVLYALFTGRPPFQGADLRTLIHAHLAVKPEPPKLLNQEIPEPVSDLIMKLLAKNPEDRYQSTLGLVKDLEQCRKSYGSGGRSRFALGLHDMPERLTFSSRLFGRSREIAQIRKAYDRACQGRGELLLVSGQSGVGKTALVQDLAGIAARGRGRFLAGKYDRLQSLSPWHGLAQAVANLARQLLGEGGAGLDEWKGKLLQGLEGNSGLLNELAPEMEQVLGPQAPLPELGPMENLNRRIYLFQELFKAISTMEEPLVLFLDDLQWADPASLRLLDRLAAVAGERPLLVVGTYRENEVGQNHPLRSVLEDIAGQGLPMEEISLPPLARGHVTALMADALRTGPEGAEPLARILWEKTGGNPFFLRQFLAVLRERDVIRLDPAQGQWTFDAHAIEELGVADNVAELLAERLKQSPERIRQELTLAACLGTDFQGEILALVQNASEREVEKDLTWAMDQGFVLSLGRLRDRAGQERDWRFTHDRIRQAAYELLPPDERAELHLGIGRGLFSGLSEEARTRWLLDIVDHLNLGSGLLRIEQERLELVGLNGQAAAKATVAGAHAAARSYLSAALGLLPDDAWERMAEQTHGLHMGLAGACMADGDVPAARDLVMTGLAHTDEPSWIMELKGLLMLIEFLSGNHPEVVSLGSEILQGLGLDLGEPGNRRNLIEQEWARVEDMLGPDPEAWVDQAPTAENPMLSVILQTVIIMGTSTIIVDHELWALNACKAMGLILEQGLMPEASVVFHIYAIVFQIARSEYIYSGKLCEAGMKIAERYALQGNLIQTKAINLFTYEFYWKDFKSFVSIAKNKYRQALQLGDIFSATYNLSFLIFAAFQCCNNIEQYKNDFFTRIDEVFRNGNAYMYQNLIPFIDVIENIYLQDDLDHQLHISVRSSQEILKKAAELQNFIAIQHFHFQRALGFFIHGETKAAREHMDQAADLAMFSQGQANDPDYRFIHSLITLNRYPEAGKEEQETILSQVREHLGMFDRWLELCVGNYANRALLIQAELARVTGQDFEAQALYDQAVASAQEHGFVLNGALINDLAARFWSERGKEDFARLYRLEAYYGYRRWGALRRVRQLERDYPDLTLHRHERSGLKYTLSISRQALDLASVMEAGQAISREMSLTKLLPVLLRILMETAGAEKADLVLKRGQDLLVACRMGPEKEVLHGDEVMLDECSGLGRSIVRYTARTGQALVLEDASGDQLYAQDDHVRTNRVRSVLCLPIMLHDELIGLAYLENNLSPGLFSPEQLDVLGILTAQAAISIRNALYCEEVENRTREIRRANTLLEQEVDMRRRAEFAFRRAERKFREIFENAVEGIFQVSPQGGLITANPALARMLGYDDPEQLIQVAGEESAVLFVDPGDVIEINRVMDRDGHVSDAEVRLKRRDGTEIWALFGARRFMDDQGEHIYTQGSLEDITGRKRAAERIQALTRDLIRAQEDERLRISRDLHDQVAQDLSSLMLGVGEMEKSGTGFSRTLQRAIDTVRDLSYALRPPELDRLGLVKTLDRHCREFGERTGLNVEFKATGMEAAGLTPEMEIHLYRIAQEGLNNAHKHAMATAVEVKLLESHPYVLLSIRDNGQGFDVSGQQARAVKERRMGMQGMEERVGLLGGSLTIKSSAGQGTLIRVEVPAGGSI